MVPKTMHGHGGAAQDAHVDRPAPQARPRARVPAARALLCFNLSHECSQLSGASGSVRLGSGPVPWGVGAVRTQFHGRLHRHHDRRCGPRRCCRRYRWSQSTGPWPLVAVNPPEKNLMKVGMGTWVLRGIDARSHGGHRVRFAPSLVHGISLGPPWDRLEAAMETRGRAGSSSGHGVMPGSS